MMKSYRLYLLFIFTLFPLYFFGQNQKRIDSLETVIARSKEDTNKVEALLKLVEAYRNSDPSHAKELCTTAVKLAEKLDHQQLRAMAYFHMAILFRRESNYEESIRYYLESLKIYEKLGSKVNVGKVYGSLGIAYWQQGNFKTALDYYKKSLAVCYEANDKNNISSNLNNIGGIYCEMNQLDSGLAYFTRSLELTKEMKDTSGLAEVYGNIGNVYLFKEDYANALANYELSLRYSELSGNKYSMLTAYGNIGTINAKQKKFAEAVRNTEKALQLGRELNSLHNMKDNYKSMAEIYADMGNTAKAYEYYKKYSTLKDSLLNEENLKQINEMQAKYQSEKKDNEIKLLNKDAKLKEAEIQQQKAEAARQGIIRNGLIIGFVLLLGLAFFIFRSYRLKKRSNIEIAHQKEIIEAKNKEITDSIHYAKRIQGALLAGDNLLKKHLSEFFILYKPKDIVSGDFYWASLTNGKLLMITADCTGHGVPGAFMSLLNISLLNEITIERKVVRPDLVLNNVREEITRTLNPEGNENNSKDGMDCVLCSFDLQALQLEFACANNPLWMIRHNELIEFKPDKQPVGPHSEQKPFTLQATGLQKGDTIYTFTDGYADQFGGPNGKKFKYGQLKELLLSIHKKSMNEQKAILENTIETWKGRLEQVDDICVIGVRI